MQKITTKFPTIKDLESTLFRRLQELFAEGMRRILEALDDWIMEHRDSTRFRLKDQREISIETLFGTVRFKRRLYLDRKTGKHVFLLDQMLQYEGRDKLSPYLEELAIQFASQGPSYRDSAQRLKTLLGYPVLSHEAIRDKLIEQAERPEPAHNERRPVRVLFVEVDGLYTKLQRDRRRGMENRIAVVHEGWENEGGRIRLKAKRHYLHTGEGDFWEGFGDFLVQHYDVDEQTWLVVNGDGAALPPTSTIACLPWTGFMWPGSSNGMLDICPRHGKKFEKHSPRLIPIHCWGRLRLFRKRKLRKNGGRNGGSTGRF